MFLIELLSFHFDALTRLVGLVSFLRSWASFSVSTPFSKSLLISASADCAQILAWNASEPNVTMTTALNALFNFILVAVDFTLHCCKVAQPCYRTTSGLLQLGDETMMPTYPLSATVARGVAIG